MDSPLMSALWALERAWLCPQGSGSHSGLRREMVGLSAGLSRNERMSEWGRGENFLEGHTNTHECTHTEALCSLPCYSGQGQAQGYVRSGTDAVA